MLLSAVSMFHTSSSSGLLASEGLLGGYYRDGVITPCVNASRYKAIGLVVYVSESMVALSM